MSSSDGDLEGYHHGCMQGNTSGHHHHHVTQPPTQVATTRRRSSFGQNHFPQQLSSTAIMYQEEPPEVTTPSRYDRYEENITCCLPPPSPAPNSDRFVMGLSPGNIPQSQGHHYKDHRLMAHHRTMSPSSRYRTGINERYRDLASPKCEGYASPAHYLANSTPMASTNDTYGTYLSSTVHTPVKRYIPTPPPHGEPYESATISNSGGYHLSLPIAAGTPPPTHTQTLKPQKSSQSAAQPQYRIRMKCCNNDGQPMQIKDFHGDTNGNSDHYATPPRIRQSSSASSSAASTLRRPQQAANTTPQCEYISRTPSSEFLGGGTRVATPLDLNGSASCLHCNTIRRTTGVHQTTQTTGPVSPLPPLSSCMDMNSVGSRHEPKDPSPVQQPPVQPVVKEPEPEPSPPPPPATASINGSSRSLMFQYHNDSAANLLTNTFSQQRNAPRAQNQTNSRSKKQKVKDYVRRETAKFFGVHTGLEATEQSKWHDRQARLAKRCFGALVDESETNEVALGANQPAAAAAARRCIIQAARPDILPAPGADEAAGRRAEHARPHQVARKDSVAQLMWRAAAWAIHAVKRKSAPPPSQWSRSFAPADVKRHADHDLCDGLAPLHPEETFFEAIGTGQGNGQSEDGGPRYASVTNGSERTNGWRTRAVGNHQEIPVTARVGEGIRTSGRGGTRIAAHLLDGVLDNSRRAPTHPARLLKADAQDDRRDYRPFFTYWINTVHILVLAASIGCYGLGPIGIGTEHKAGQVLVTSLSLQQVQHQEPRNVWIGPRGLDLVHLGAKFAACMRRDAKILDVAAKIRRQERETACCIRNDDSGCVQSSQADCSVRGLWPSQKTIATWKKWSPGDSGPGGRISGSVCGLDPKYCDAPASIAPYEWPDDITKWPICRKTNSFSHRFRLKDHTAEHMVCEVIGHPCCTGVYGECRITTKEYCDFVNGYFHEEASLCSQVSCLTNVCGMFPFLVQDVPDQFYRLFTSLCLHAGLLHLAITVAFQHIFLSDLERLLGPLRTAIVYIGSGIAGNLTSVILVPYRPEVGPLASMAGVLGSLAVMLGLCHWRRLKKPWVAMVKLLVLAAFLFGLGSLPWQENFAGIIAGLASGTTLTLALVPFLQSHPGQNHSRKNKIQIIWVVVVAQAAIWAAMFVVFYIFPALFASFGWIGGAHPNDHFATGQTGHFDHEHNNNLHGAGGGNMFGGYNNYNTGGGIVSSGGTPPHHLNIGPPHNTATIRPQFAENIKGRHKRDTLDKKFDLMRRARK